MPFRSHSFWSSLRLQKTKRGKAQTSFFLPPLSVIRERGIASQGTSKNLKIRVFEIREKSTKERICPYCYSNRFWSAFLAIAAFSLEFSCKGKELPYFKNPLIKRRLKHHGVWNSEPDPLVDPWNQRRGSSNERGETTLHLACIQVIYMQRILLPRGREKHIYKRQDLFKARILFLQSVLCLLSLLWLRLCILTTGGP